MGDSSSGTRSILEEIHEYHLGICRMKAFARRYVWWPNLDIDIEDTVQNCPSCMSVRNCPKTAALHPWIWATRPYQRIHIDYAEFKGQSLLIVDDSYSKWLEAIPVKSSTSTNTINKLYVLFASTGLPEKIVSDNGPQFSSHEFKDITRQNGIKHTLVPQYHPQCNGFAERGVQIVKKALKCKEVDGVQQSLEHRLADFLLKYRVTELLLKRQLRIRLSFIKPDVGKRVENSQQKIKDFHDRGIAKVRVLDVGEKTTVKPGKWKWLPGWISKRCGALTYLVRVGNRTRFCHIDHLLTCQANLLEERPIISEPINIHPALQTKSDAKSQKNVKSIDDLTSEVPSAENLPSMVDSPSESEWSLTK